MRDTSSAARHTPAAPTPTPVVVGAIVAVFAMVLVVLIYAAISARHHTEPEQLQRAAERALSHQPSP